MPHPGYDFVIRQGDTKPALTYTLTDATGAALNLTGATVNFVMRTLTSSTPAINASATVTNASAGTVSFSFSGTQTATAGQFMANFVVTYGDGSIQTAPADGYIDVLVEENLTTAGGNLIISLAEAKDYLNIPATMKTDDAKIVRMIKGLGPVVEFIVGPVIQKVVEEWHDGGTDTVILRQRPVSAVIAVTEYVGPIAWPLAIIQDPSHGQIYSCEVELSTGRIVRRTVGGGTTAFTSGRQTVQVSYYAGRATIEPNVTLGALELLRVNYSQTQRRRPQIGIPGYEVDDQEPGREIMGFFVPNRVRELLLPSKKPPAVF